MTAQHKRRIIAISLRPFCISETNGIFVMARIAYVVFTNMCACRLIDKGLLQNSWYMQNMAFRTQESYPYIVYKLHFATALLLLDFCQLDAEK